MAYDDTVSGRLAAVRTAIQGCLLSQDYTASGQRVMMAQLRDLRQLEKELMEEGQIASDGFCSLGQIVPVTP
jgi:hypothetical protein